MGIEDRRKIAVTNDSRNIKGSFSFDFVDFFNLKNQLFACNLFLFGPKNWRKAVLFYLIGIQGQYFHPLSHHGMGAIWKIFPEKMNLALHNCIFSDIFPFWEKQSLK